MSQLFTSPLFNRRIFATRSFVVLVVTLVIIVEMVPSALAVTIVEFPVPTPQSTPFFITPGPDGNLWFTEFSGNKIGKITPTGAVTEFPLAVPGALPSGITAAPDGNLWFTEPGIASIGRITPMGSITQFSIPTLKSDLASSISMGPDGALWFTDGLSNSIGKITTQGLVKEFLVPTKGGGPASITAGPDGALWFTEKSANQIGRLTPGGVFTEFPVPTGQSGAEVITTGPDGNLWFTEVNVSQIARITAAGAVTEFQIPTQGSQPVGIVSGPDGGIWFTEAASNKIGRFQVVLGPGAAASAEISADTGEPTSAAAGPAPVANEITPAAGSFTEFPLAAGKSAGPIAITTGPDHNLWFTEGSGSAIGRLVPDVQQLTADLSITITSSAPSVASGTQLSYTIAVSNAGPQTATGVTVNTPVPSGTSFSSVSGAGVVITPPPPGFTGVIAAALGSTLPGGVGRFQVTVNVLAASGTNLSPTATVTSTSTDPNPANNTATATIPVQGGGIVFLSWHQGPSTTTNATPPPDHLTVSGGRLPAGLDTVSAEALEPADTPPCTLTGYNIYISTSTPVLTTDAPRWKNVPPDMVQAMLPSASSGSFYVITSLWNCGGTIVESGGSNTASTCGGPELDRVKIGGKMKIFGNNFTDPASVFVDGFEFSKLPIFIDSTFLKQKGTINAPGNPDVLTYLGTNPVIVITVQVGSQTNPCISSISFGP